MNPKLKTLKVVIPWRGFRCFTLEDVFVFEFEVEGDEL